MFFQCINIRQVPWEVLKTMAFGLGFQHLPRDLANVNAWKTMFDPYTETVIGDNKKALCNKVKHSQMLNSVSNEIYTCEPKSGRLTVWLSRWFRYFDISKTKMTSDSVTTLLHKHHNTRLRHVMLQDYVH